MPQGEAKVAAEERPAERDLRIPQGRGGGKEPTGTLTLNESWICADSMDGKYAEGSDAGTDDDRAAKLTCETSWNASVQSYDSDAATVTENADHGLGVRS